MSEVIRKLTLKSCAARGPIGPKGDSDAVKIVNVTGSDAVITPENNHIYKCGELASLTVQNPPETGCYSIIFSSGVELSDPTELSGLSGINGADFTPAAATRYEINVLDNFAVVGSWDL